MLKKKFNFFEIEKIRRGSKGGGGEFDIYSQDLIFFAKREMTINSLPNAMSATAPTNLRAQQRTSCQ